MTGIEFYLTKKIYGPEQHPNGWDKYVYDDENVHYALIQILIENSQLFTQTFLGLETIPEEVDVFPQPDRGLFDLKFTVGKIQTYCEVKVWAGLSEDQFQRQNIFLKEQDAKGIYVLFTKAADAWPSAVVSERSEGRCKVLGIQDMIDAIDSIGTDIPEQVSEIARAYKMSLSKLYSRW
jgi:hypothetical protein